MLDRIQAKLKIPPPLDPNFLPAALWNRAYQKLLAVGGDARTLGIALERGDGSVSVHETRVLPHQGAGVEANELYVERLVKFLLWQKGGSRIVLAGEKGIADHIASVYSPSGARAFDYHFMGEQVYGVPMRVEHAPADARLQSKETTAALGRHFDGCRIGFDLGGSDRKSAAVIDGEVVFSEEIPWDPYFKTDPAWHFEQINDSLRRAAAHMPRVDAIGGSSAGVYVNNEVRVASLFRGVPRDIFDTRVRRIFWDLKAAWNGIPFVVVNDGEVTALAGSMALEDNAVLGVAMGTSQAAGYVTSQGTITNWLNELAFAPLDYQADAHVDEWSGDAGCGAQYFSQQAVGRLHRPAGIDLPDGMPLPEKLVQVQKLMEADDERARLVYETMGVYFGYTVAHYADFYDVRNLLVLGRVMSGKGGDLILSTAKRVLAEEFPGLADRIHLQLPGEKEKRHGQAVAAASLPVLG
jgi:predicted NBD/HSP70 family sugar kinase